MCEMSNRPAAGAHGVVLGQVGGVADGHRPAAEVGERGSERLVAISQRGVAGVWHEFSRFAGWRTPGSAP